MSDNLVNCLGLIVSIEVLFLLCRINYDNDEDIKRNKVSESSAKDLLQVREFDGSPKVHRECYRN